MARRRLPVDARGRVSGAVLAERVRLGAGAVKPDRGLAELPADAPWPGRGRPRRPNGPADTRGGARRRGGCAAPRPGPTGPSTRRVSGPTACSPRRRGVTTYVQRARPRSSRRRRRRRGPSASAGCRASRATTTRRGGAVSSTTISAPTPCTRSGGQIRAPSTVLPRARRWSARSAGDQQDVDRQSGHAEPGLRRGKSQQQRGQRGDDEHAAGRDQCGTSTVRPTSSRIRRAVCPSSSDSEVRIRRCAQAGTR